MECNATAAFNVTHHFVSKLVTKNPRDVLSSLPVFNPTPFSGMHGATKAFCSQLATSLHIELNSLGIDVCAVRTLLPSPPTFTTI
jgi:short-subunit dehydrogenase